MDFRVVGEITEVQTIAESRAIRDLEWLRKRHGAGRWRKRKGVCRVQIAGGAVYLAEVHWYEAHGKGRRDFKIKRFLD